MGRSSYLVVAALAALSWGCERVLAPREVSYLAIVAIIDAPTGISPGSSYTYRIRDMYGHVGIDTTVAVAPADTVILPLPAATYHVKLGGVPETCVSRYGADYQATVDEGPYTTTIRYFVSCLPPLVVRLQSDGANVSPEYVYRLVAPDGAERLGVIAADDTLSLDSLPPGRYEFGLHMVPPHCVVTTDGGARRIVDVVRGGGTMAEIHIFCSDEASRPVLLEVRAAYAGGAGLIWFRARDPNRDIERYYWDLTDCRGTSILPQGARVRRGLSSSGRTAGQDTIMVISAFEVGLPDSIVAGSCTAVRVADEPSNTTPVWEVPTRRPVPTAAPLATTFNAVYIGTQAVRTTLIAGDPNGDFLGVFAAARLRDGILGPVNGEPDIGIYNVSGYLLPNVPDLPLNSRIQYGDVLGIIIYLVDSAGNFARLEDADVFH